MIASPCSTYCRRCCPEIVLVVGAMALLMLGVFRPENDREAEAIGWLAIAGARRRRPGSRSSSRRARRRCSTAPSSSTASRRFMKLLTLAAAAGALLLSFDYMRETQAR